MKKFIFYSLLGVALILFGASLQMGCNKKFSPIVPNLGSPTPSSSTTPTGLDVTAPVSLAGGSYSYDYVWVHTGGCIYLAGPVTFNLSSYLAVDGGASIIGDDFSESENSGTPAGTTSAGAGHGGQGGADGLGNPGGITYDTPLNPSQAGSMGAFGACSNYGAGGGAIFRTNVADGAATLNGYISMQGRVSLTCGSVVTGAGSGGTIYIQAPNITGGGYLNVNGGEGLTNATDNAGGGGGGMILLSYHLSNNFTGSYFISGGSAVAPAESGQDGTANTGTY